MSEQNEHMQTRTFQFSNAIVNVYFSQLTEEKRIQRTKAMYKSAEDLLKSRERKTNAG